MTHASHSKAIHMSKQPNVTDTFTSSPQLQSRCLHVQDSPIIQQAKTSVNIKQSRLVATMTPAGSMLGAVELCAEHAQVGYISHPALVDSSMHLSIFLDGSDGRTRVPGKTSLILLAHSSLAFSLSFSLI